MISRSYIPADFASSPSPCSVGRYHGPGGLWRADRAAHPGGQCLREAQVLVGFTDGSSEWSHAPFCHKHDPIRIDAAVRAQRETQRASARLHDVPTRVLERELARRKRW